MYITRISRASKIAAALILVSVGICSIMHSRAYGADMPRQSGGIKVMRDIPYITGGDPAQKLDLYLPEHASDRPLPLVIWIHGGGWEAGSKDGCYLQFLVGQGYAAASIEYRFSQKALFPAQIQDCQAAIRWLRANSKKYNLDAKHFGVGGDSAGGHLAALVGTAGGKKAFAPTGGNENQSDRVQAVVDFYGPADFNTVMSQGRRRQNQRVRLQLQLHGDPYSQLIGVNLGADSAKGDAVSPVHFVSRTTPPFLILHGTVDSLVPFAQNVELLDSLHKAGVEAMLQPFQGSGHGGVAFNYPAVHKLIKDFFDKHLRNERVTIEALPESAVTVPPLPTK